MSNDRERVLALIPAKGASTRFPMKNVALLKGRTLLEWTAAAARDSGLFARIVLSTEDDAVMAAARDAGIDVPFRRPPELARDPAGIVQVALHALSQLESLGDIYETLIILPPTSPLRTSADICDAYALFTESQRQFVMSVSKFEHTPFAALRINSEGRLEPIFPELIGRKSQEMPAAYRPNGAIHVLDVERFRTVRSYFEPPLVPYVMPRDRSVDVDTREDLALAEVILAESRR